MEESHWWLQLSGLLRKQKKKIQQHNLFSNLNAWTDVSGSSSIGGCWVQIGASWLLLQAQSQGLFQHSGKIRVTSKNPLQSKRLPLGLHPGDFSPRLPSCALLNSASHFLASLSVSFPRTLFRHSRLSSTFWLHSHTYRDNAPRIPDMT